ncbi:hypothetical protein CC78DRAFT_587038 [Lojkania enalia]|uniref:Uncharacterized protein n=1 Tax=Lojkania enalia TaxID=147567 RepID=A0A9P4N4P8_9PLEO|nr:hypothetical protein CC78DRAFT_587038 [Didymosphaeria enalia]
MYIKGIRRLHTLIESIILLLAIITLCFVIAYLVQLSKAQLSPNYLPGNTLGYKYPHGSPPPQSRLMAESVWLFIAPTLLTISESLVAVYKYNRKTLSPVYSAVVATTMLVVWSVMAGLWGNCNIRPTAGDSSVSYCYTSYLSIYDSGTRFMGLSNTVVTGVVAMPIILALGYFVSLTLAAIDMHRARWGGEPDESIKLADGIPRR